MQSLCSVETPYRLFVSPAVRNPDCVYLMQRSHHGRFFESTTPRSETARKDVPRRIPILSVSKPHAGQEFSRTHSDSSVSTSQNAHCCSSRRLDRYEVRSFPLALVFRHPFERNPRRRRCVLTIFREFEHPFHVVDFDGYEVVFPHLIRRQPIEKVTAFSLDSLVAFGHLQSCFSQVAEPCSFRESFR